jgi:hypothetical protein
MHRFVWLLAVVATPLIAQTTPSRYVQTTAQFTYLRLRGGGGTVPGAAGSGLSIRLGALPFTSAPRLGLEAAFTWTPRDESAHRLTPEVRAATLGALYALHPATSRPRALNPFVLIAAGLMTYDAPVRDPSPCVPEEGCLSEWTPLRGGTKPTVTLGAGVWCALGSKLGLQADLRLHHRQASVEGEEPALKRELSVGLGYRL